MTEPVSLWDSIRDYLPWVPGIYAVFRVERNAAESHSLLFDEHGQTRVITTEMCEKCRVVCKTEGKLVNDNLQRELQNIHVAIQSIQELLVKIAGGMT